jgi:hypothetical protein
MLSVPDLHKGHRPYAVFYIGMVSAGLLLYFAGSGLSYFYCGQMYGSEQPAFNWRKGVKGEQARMHARIKAVCKKNKLTRPKDEASGQKVTEHLIWQQVGPT